MRPRRIKDLLRLRIATRRRRRRRRNTCTSSRCRIERRRPTERSLRDDVRLVRETGFVDRFGRFDRFVQRRGLRARGDTASNHHREKSENALPKGKLAARTRSKTHSFGRWDLATVDNAVAPH